MAVDDGLILKHSSRREQPRRDDQNNQQLHRHQVCEQMVRFGVQDRIGSRVHCGHGGEWSQRD